MGIIEYAFADISAAIGKSVVERGWVAHDRLVHYKLHAEIDTRHADEFFAVVEPQWDDPKRRYFVKQGLELGAYIFNRLYQDMYVGARRGD
jgi:pyrroloquinoline-quinone synthase